MFNKCYTCRAIIVAGGINFEQEGEKIRFCCNDCLRWAINSEFCKKCIDETVSESTGTLETFNHIGWTFFGKRNHCEVCNSYIKSVRYAVIGVPTVLKGNYRVKSYGRKADRFISRRLKDQNQ